MRKQIAAEVRQLTKDFLAWFRGLPQVEGDRSIGDHHGKTRYQWLATQLESGGMYSPTWDVAINKQDGRWYRVNGNTSSTVFEAANGTMPTSMMVFLRTHECTTMEDVVDLFNTFDNKKSLRTFAQKTNVHKRLHDELSQLAPSYIIKIITGIVTAWNDGNIRKIDEDDRVQVMHSELDFFVWALPYVHVNSMHSGGVVAAMYKTFKLDREAATVFWDLVKDESSGVGCPTRVLRKMLEEDLRIKRWDSRAKYVKSIHAWNAWCEGTTTMLNYFAAADVPRLKYPQKQPASV